MRIKNNYHKALAFEIDGKPFGIGPGEEKEVDDELGKRLLENFWISKVSFQIPKVETKKKVLKKTK